MTLTMKLIWSSVSSVIATLQACTRLAVTSQCVKSPRHLSQKMSSDGIASMTRVASCSTTQLSRRQELRKFRSFVNLVSGKLSTDPAMRLSLERDGSTSAKETKANRSTASRKNTNVKQIGHFTATPEMEVLRTLLICVTNEELPNDVGQPVALSEPVVLMLIDVRRAQFCSPARRKVFVELPAEAGTDESKVGRLLRRMHVLSRRRSELGIRELPSHDCNSFCARLSITVHLPPSGKATPCVGTWRRLRAPWSHRQCQMFFL